MIRNVLFQFHLVASLVFSKLVCVSAATFSPPSGPFNTTLTIAELVDHTRLDPFSPTPAPRRLMVSIFHPSTCLALPTPYMDPLTAAWTEAQVAQYGAPPGAITSLSLLTCPPSNQAPSKLTATASTSANRQHLGLRNRDWKGNEMVFPLVLFSPGLGNPRLLYSAIAQEVASKGFTVVTIDHPYDAGIVVFPDNSTIVGGNISTGGQLLENLDVRVLDASFVLDSLSNTSIADSLIPGVGKDGIDVDNVGFFGHSFGGATAAQAMLRDQRLKGGVNLDGSFFGTVIQDGLERPFIIFANEVHNTTDDPSWAAIWPKLKGWKRELILEGSVHGTFTDFPDIVDVLGLKGKLPPEAGQVLGSIDGARVLEILGEYVGGFFEFVLKGRKVGLLDGPSERFPEIEFGHPDA